MKSRKKPSGARVRRITIDERLDEGLLKVAVADLLPGHDDLSDDPLDAWSEESLELISREDFLGEFGLEPRDPLLATLVGIRDSVAADEDPEGAFWRTLEEGQVFLVGEIGITGDDREAPEGIHVRTGTSTVLRIDRIDRIKKKHEALYSMALSKRG